MIIVSCSGQQSIISKSKDKVRSLNFGPELNSSPLCPSAFLSLTFPFNTGNKTPSF